MIKNNINPVKTFPVQRHETAIQKHKWVSNIVSLDRECNLNLTPLSSHSLNDSVLLSC